MQKKKTQLVGQHQSTKRRLNGIYIYIYKCNIYCICINIDNIIYTTVIIVIYSIYIYKVYMCIYICVYIYIVYTHIMCMYIYIHTYIL